MSLSVICPTPASSTRTFTSSWLCFSTVAWIASALPCTSALIRTRDFLLLAGLDAGQHLVERAARRGGRRRRPCRAACAGGTRRSRARGFRSPPPRTARRPTARRPGPGSPPASTARLRCSCRPLSSSIARTRPHSAPATHDVALVQRALLHQHGRDRAAAPVEPAFDHRALAPRVPGWPSGRALRPAAGSPRPACRARSASAPRPRRPGSRRPSPRPRPRG